MDFTETRTIARRIDLKKPKQTNFSFVADANETVKIWLQYCQH